MHALRKLAFITAACSALTGITAAMPAVSLSASAETVQTSGICGEDDLYAERYVRWELDPTTGTLTISGQGNMYNYLEDYDPTGLYDYWTKPENLHYFDRAEPAPWGKNIKKVIIEEGVKAIGRYAFCGCRDLESVTLSETLETIEGYAFGNSGIREITVPGKAFINDCAFYACSALKTVNVSVGLSAVGSYAFFNCTALESMELPPFIYYIGDCAFSGCTKLSGLTLPYTLTEIGTDAFADTAWLAEQFSQSPYIIQNEQLIACSPDLSDEIELPDGIVTVSTGVFRDNTKITSVIIPDGVEMIRPDAFSGCTALKEVLFPSTLVGIDAEAFRGCKALESVDFPERLSFIGQEAFRGCSSLTDLLLPMHIGSLGYGAFADCESLQHVTVQNPFLWLSTPPDSELQYFSNAGGKFTGTISGYEESGIQQYANEHHFKFKSLGYIPLYADPQNTCGLYLKWSVDENGTLTISGEGDMFDFWYQPDYTEDPDYYEDPAMYSSSSTPWNANIKAVVIEEGVTGIGAGAFLGCSELKSVVIPDSVKRIGMHAFEDCLALTSIDIPDGVTRIGEYTFRNTALSAPVLPDTLKSIGSGAFTECSNLTRIVIPDGVLSIGADAFKGCTKLSSVKLTDSITDVGPRAFESTAWLNSREKKDTFVIEKGILLKASSKLTGNITVPDGVRVIGGMAFQYIGYVSPGSDDAKQVPVITIPEGVTTISELAFCWCTTLKTVNLPSTLTTIGNSAFFNCFSLDHVTLPGNLRTIGANAFGNCESLKEITIPKSVNRIGRQAFDKCDSLKAVTILNPAAEIYDSMDTFTNASGIENKFSFPYSGVIRGYSGSTAERYANRFERTFEQLDSSYSDTHMLGDLTGDGSVDVSDAVLLARFLNADTEAVVTDQGRINADCNQDGNTDTADLTDLLRFIAKKITF